MALSPASDTPPQLSQRLGPWSAIGIVIGITIGSGIFRTPAVVASRVPDPWWFLGVWLVGGVITLCGALSIAELGAAFPKTGGLYVFLREGWGRPLAFLFGWSELVLIRASALGGIASVFGSYLLRSIGFDPIAHTDLASYVAAAAIITAGLANIRGATVGAAIAGLSSIAKVAALSVLIVAAFLLGGRHGGSLAHFAGSTPVGPEPGLFGLALVSVLWAYDGFVDLSFVAGEMNHPQRTFPRALFCGTTAIVGIYLLANAAYLYVTPIQQLAASQLIAADTMGALFGQLGVAAVSVTVAISAFGSLNGSMLTSPRVFFAMADDGMFFRQIAQVHPEYRTPFVAIALATVLGTVGVLTRSFEQLTDTFVLAIWPFYALGVAAIFRLRRRRPDLPRPYRVTGYPFVPLVFIAGVMYFLANALISDPRGTALVCGIILAGALYYGVAFRSRK